MSAILILLRKEFALFQHNKAVVSLTFAVPMAVIYIFGQVFGLDRDDSGPSGIPLAVVNASADPVAGRLVAALQAEKSFAVITTLRNPDGTRRPLADADLRGQIQDNAFRFALVLPADLMPAEQPGLHLKLYSNPRNEIETQTVNGMLQKVIFSRLPELLGQVVQVRARQSVGDTRLDAFNRALAGQIAGTFGGNAEEIRRSIEQGNFGLTPGPAAAPAGGRANADVFGQLLRLETEQVVGRDVRAAAATRVVGGFAIQFLLFALSASATGLFYERDYGLFQRILSGPVTRAQILWSKFFYGTALGLIQLLVLFGAGRLLYGIDVEHHLGLLVVVSVAAAGACTALGMLIAACTSSRETAMGMASFIIITMCCVGGAWFPTSLMPPSIQTFSKLTLVYWAMEGYDQVLWAGAPLIRLLPTLGILGGMTALLLGLAIWRFNRSRLFE
jgi:ABC-2 type transport system permease protein